MKKVIKKYHIEICLFFFAALLQATTFLLIKFYGNFLDTSDSGAYITIGKNLIKYRGFFLNIIDGPQSAEMPIYPLFVAFFYWIIPKIEFIIAMQNIIAAFNVVLVFYLTKLIFNKKIAVWSAILFSISSQRLYFANQIMTETIFTTFVVLMLYFFIKFEFNSNHRKIKYLILASLFLGLSAITRPTTLYLVPLLALFLIARGLWKKEYKKYLISAVLIVIVFLVTISPWLIRNKIHFGSIKASAVGEYNLYAAYAVYFLDYKYRGEITEYELYFFTKGKFIKDLERGVIDGKAVPLVYEYTPKAMKEALKTLPMPPDEFNYFATGYASYYTDEFFKIIAIDHKAAAGLYTREIIKFFADSGFSKFLSRITGGVAVLEKILYPYVWLSGRAVWLFINSVIILGILFFWRKVKERIWLYLFIFMILCYFAGLSGFTNPGEFPRYRLPVEPLLYLLFVYFGSLFADKIWTKKH